MYKNWIAKSKRIYLDVINSIAFYPTIISIGFVILSIVIMRIEFNEYVIESKKSISQFLVHDEENARLILGTIVGSLISLMVFSFSMVMVVLNSATSTLSPRVLPGLISNKFHQIVLGFYTGSIVFSLVLIININSPEVEYSVPSLGILISLSLSVTCLALFVYFIHSISQKIQVENILDGIYFNTKIQLKQMVQEAYYGCPNTDDWFDCNSDQSGYLKMIDLTSLKRFCEKENVVIHVKQHLGAFLIKNQPMLKLDRPISDELKKELMALFVLYTEERVADHYLFGFKQISEIAVKALSPGINDPGTAIKAIDLLTDLFILRMAVSEKCAFMNTNGKVCVYLEPIKVRELLLQTMIPIRIYGKSDIYVIKSLLKGVSAILFSLEDQEEYQNILHEMCESIMSSSDCYHSKVDFELINESLKGVNRYFSKEKQIAFL